jgi:beta-glucanase (GH16 family)
MLWPSVAGKDITMTLATRRLALMLTAACLLAVPTLAEAAGPDLAGYKLILDDEFKGDKLDLAKWQVGIQPNGGEWGSDSYFVTSKAEDRPMFNQVYTVKDGVLNIRAIYKADFVDPSGWNRKWYSGMIATAFSNGRPPSAVFRRGYVEIRQKFPTGSGVWPSSWAVNMKSQQAGGDPEGTLEIDGIEGYGNDMTVMRSTVHNWGDKSYSAGVKEKLPDMSADFHTYGFLVGDTEVICYFDGEEVHRLKLLRPQIQDKFFWMFNLAMGGGWPITMPESGHYDMQIDYIRIYSKDDDAVAVKPRTP